MLVFRARPRKDPTTDAGLTNSERRIMRILGDAMREVRDQVISDEGKILDAVMHSSADRVANLVTVEPWLAAQPLIQQELYQELVSAGQRVKLPPIRKATLTFGFDAERSEASRWAAKEAGSLIVEVVQEQVTSVRDYVSRSLLGEFTPQQVARNLRGTIGLTNQQAGWVENFRQRQITDRVSGGMSFDRAVAESERATNRYHDRIHKYRTETIARTEILRASAEGRREAWQQGVQDGFIGNDWVKVWSTEQDARTCEECGPLDGQTAPVLGDFSWGDPPLHPNCRCTLLLEEPQEPTEFADLTDDELEAFIYDLMDNTTQVFPSNYNDPDLERASKGMSRNSICSRSISSRFRRDSDPNEAWECFNDASENPLSAANRIDTGKAERDTKIVAALSSYQGSSPQFNAAMEGRTEMTPRKRTVINGVQQAIDKSGGLPDNTLLYRGLRGGATSIGNLGVGDILEESKFVSTSFAKPVAERFRDLDDKSGWLMIIEAPTGTKGVPMTQFRTDNPQFRDEHEYLLGPSRLQVINKDETSRTLICRIVK